MPGPDGVRAVLFDVDDTLYDREAVQATLLEAIAAELPELFGRLQRERMLAAFLDSDRRVSGLLDQGKPVREPRLERCRIFLEILDRDPGAAESVNRVYLQRYDALAPEVPGAGEVVKRLHARNPLGVVSNGFRDIQHRKLQALGLRRFFRCIVLSDEFGIRKPDRRSFEEGCRLLGLESSECLYVGDSFEYDVRGARGAGMSACWFNRLRHTPPAGEPAPDLVISSLWDLVAALGA